VASRIAVNETLARLCTNKQYEEPEREGDRMDRCSAPKSDPEQAAVNFEMWRLMEAMIDSLPHGNRAVFVLRDMEDMNTAETSQALGISEENVKVRLHRARAELRNGLSAYANRQTRNAYAFHAVRCDRVVENVFERIRCSTLENDSQLSM
jgi:RNA polymerase sigma-70 factor, ECF subfamily